MRLLLEHQRAGGQPVQDEGGDQDCGDHAARDSEGKEWDQAGGDNCIVRAFSGGDAFDHAGAIFRGCGRDAARFTVGQERSDAGTKARQDSDRSADDSAARDDRGASAQFVLCHGPVPWIAAVAQVCCFTIQRVEIASLNDHLGNRQHPYGHGHEGNTVFEFKIAEGEARHEGFRFEPDSGKENAETGGDQPLGQ